MGSGCDSVGRGVASSSEVSSSNPVISKKVIIKLAVKKIGHEWSKFLNI